MSVKKGRLLLGLMLFLAMFLVPLLSLGGGGAPPGKTGSGVRAESRQSQPSVSGSRQFRIKDTSTGKILTVDDRTFLCGAVAAEMSPLAPAEALKAQAVASYTYYSRLRESQRKSPSSASGGADFTADPQNWNIYVTKEEMQKRWGSNYGKYYGTLSTVAGAVSGQVLKYSGQLIDATYFAISSGNTEDAEDVWGTKCAYLVSVASPCDAFAGGYRTTVSYSEAEMKTRIRNAAPKADLSGPASGWVGKTERSGAGGVKTIVLGGQTVTGGKARSAFALRSSNFTVSYANGQFTFSVLGYGHGVGMSQTGAEAMARQGSGYKQILAWYYPSSTLTSL
jgi:stage II sporulation protein D